MRRPELTGPAALGHLDGLRGVDRVGLVVSLVAIPTLPAAALLAAATSPAREVPE